MAWTGSPALVLAVAILVVGCSMGSSPPEPAISPAPVPDRTRQPTDRLAPGVTIDGIRWPDVLVDTHARVLGRTSYTVVSIRSANSTNPDSGQSGG